jgi:hypothetical protein
VNLDPVDLSLVSLSADAARREALIQRVLAPRLPTNLWTVITSCRRIVVACSVAPAVAAAIVCLVVARPRAPVIPEPVARLLASPSTPTPVELMDAMAELPR